MKSVSTSQLALITGGELIGDGGVLISGVANIADAGEGDLVFAETEQYMAQALHSQASAILAAVNPGNTVKPVIVVTNPRIAYVKLLNLLAEEKAVPAGIHPTASIDPSAKVAKSAHIGFSACVAAGAVIGDDAYIGPFCYIGPGASVGKKCLLHLRVTISGGSIVGDNCILHPGAVIGADGFGYVQEGVKHIKITHVGNVVLGTDVEVGCNTTIDRARTGSTVVGSGTKIDNLVHVGHNCTIGENCLIVAQTGIAGTCEIGNSVTLAGQSGLKDHIQIGDGATIGAKSGVIQNVPAGQTYAGYYCRPRMQEMRIRWAEQYLPELVKKVLGLPKGKEQDL